MVMNNILGNLTGLRGLVGAQRPIDETQMPYKSHVGITDGDAAPIVYNTMAAVLLIIGVLAAGSVWTKIWEKTCPAQQQLRWGFGSPATPHNQGYMWFCSLNEAVDFQVGVLRLTQAKARETVIKYVFESDDTRLHLTGGIAAGETISEAIPTNINEMMALPEKREFKKVGEDSMLQLWYRCVTPATAEDAVGFSIPITVYQ